MITANFSKRFAAVKQRIKRLPQISEKALDSASKKDAVGFIETFQRGIRNDDFGLIRLTLNTIQQKESKGYSDPAIPLYGAGDEEKNSLINVFRIRKIKSGYRAFKSKAKHHESDLTLADILDIMEAGAVIKRGETLIVIPPRPVVTKAFRRYLGSKQKRENVQAVRDAIQVYINTGNIQKVKQFSRGLKRSEFDET